MVIYLVSRAGSQTHYDAMLCALLPLTLDIKLVLEGDNTFCFFWGCSTTNEVNLMSRGINETVAMPILTLISKKNPR